MMDRIIDWVINSDGDATGDDIRRILQPMFPDVDLNALSDRTVHRICANLYYRCAPRTRLAEYTHLDHAVDLIKKSKKILVITGAGVSVSCGIPDFRSANGIYARLHKDFPTLPNPQAMFDINYFRANPVPFFDFANELYPGRFKPSISHFFIKLLEKQGKLLRNYTQNIDTLETVAGINNVIECHGSFKSATCTLCKHTVGCDDIREDVLAKKVAICKECKAGIVKPDIVFFGEDLPSEFYEKLEIDKSEADLLIVMGSSMKVQPVGTIPRMLANSVPQILINREVMSSMSLVNCDIRLLGDCDVITAQICKMLGGFFLEHMESELKERGQVEVKELELASVEELHILATNCLNDDKLLALNALDSVRRDDDGPSSAKRVKITADDDLIVCVGDVLKEHYVYEQPNITAFKGAEIRYDLQRKEVIIGGSSPSSVASSCSSSSSNSSDERDRRRTKSFSLERLIMDDNEEMLDVRAISAPPDLCETDAELTAEENGQSDIDN